MLQYLNYSWVQDILHFTRDLLAYTCMYVELTTLFHRHMLYIHTTLIRLLKFSILLKNTPNWFFFLLWVRLLTMIRLTMPSILQCFIGNLGFSKLCRSELIAFTFPIKLKHARGHVFTQFSWNNSQFCKYIYPTLYLIDTFHIIL